MFFGTKNIITQRLFSRERLISLVKMRVLLLEALCPLQELCVGLVLPPVAEVAARVVAGALERQKKILVSLQICNYN